MRAKVLSMIVVIAFFLGLMYLGFDAFKLELSGFWDYLAVIIVRIYVISGTILGAVFTIKWFWRD